VEVQEIGRAKQLGLEVTDTDPEAAVVNARMAGKAQTGGTSSYLAVTDSASLEAALTTAIVGAVASCTFPLTDVPVGLTNLAISARDSSGSNVKIPQDSSHGWTFTDSSEDAILLDGTPCANLRSGAYTSFQFVCACDGVIICIDKGS
jgi:hypothetical protein